MRQFIRKVNGEPMENEIFGISMPLGSQITSGMGSSSSCVDQVFTFPTNALTSQSQPYYLTSSYQQFSSIHAPSAISAGFNPQELLISQSCAFGAEDEAEMLARGRWTPEQQFPYAYGVPGNELSLTLGSLIQSDKDQCSELSCSGVTRDRVLSPPAALTSSYLHAANQILAEITAPSLEDKYKPHDLVCAAGRWPSSLGSSGEHKTLTSMLQMIDREYDECVDRVQNAIAAFRTGTGSFPAHTPARFALHAVSALYNSLRDRIYLQMQKLNPENAFGTESSAAHSFLERQWELQKMKSESQSWRPQRGLPEKSVAVLRNWMFQNFLHPYPRDNEKQLLAIKSGLTRSQVSNWFINARVRLWKPMIEDMYQEMSRKPRREEEDG